MRSANDGGRDETAPTVTRDDLRQRVVIRPMARDDVATVRDLLWRVWSDTYTGLLGAKGVEQHCRLLHTPARLRAAGLDLDSEGNMVAELDGRIIAFCSSRLSWSGALDIHEVYVELGFQGLGLGRMLIAAMIARFPGARRIRIEVLAGNRRAIALYEELGFTPTGARNDWYQPDVQVLQLARGGGPGHYTAGQVMTIQVRALLQALGLRR